MDKIKNYIAQNYRGILTAISLICTGILFCYILTRPPVIPTSAQKTMDSLKRENTILKAQLPIYDNKITHFNGRIDSLGIVVTNNNNKSKQLTIEYDQKINTINSFNADAVYNYFINRYSADTSQIKK